MSVRKVVVRLFSVCVYFELGCVCVVDALSTLRMCRCTTLLTTTTTNSHGHGHGHHHHHPYSGEVCQFQWTAPSHSTPGTLLGRSQQAPKPSRSLLSTPSLPFSSHFPSSFSPFPPFASPTGEQQHGPTCRCCHLDLRDDIDANHYHHGSLLLLIFR